ncbi:hypothetical protein AVEN_264620-1 [Araneus ventricosus]|uniref:Uncharacterized protein n=1 Tax=Araneus ventricosus TaxID=182803 RepID=A0A4Y2VTR7_ARAVE|nr:hypothetical protein AVEN_264620-1 [Araneus ventricosus]
MLGNYGNPIYPLVDKKKSQPTETMTALLKPRMRPLVSCQGHTRQDGNSPASNTELQICAVLRSRTDRLSVDRICPKFDRNLQIMYQVHIPHFIPVSLIVLELSCSQT